MNLAYPILLITCVFFLTSPNAYTATYSFSTENGMHKIGLKTKINKKPCSVFNALTDYDNLTNVMGPGCENKEPYLETYFSVVTETPFTESTYFSTEKIFRPMLHFHPFIVYGSPYTLKNLQELGFKTFNGFIDESYDNVLSPFKRMQIITREVKRLCSMDKIDLHNWYYDMHDILLHNRELMKEYGVLYKESQKKIFEDIYEL